MASTPATPSTTPNIPQRPLVVSRSKKPYEWSNETVTKLELVEGSEKRYANALECASFILMKPKKDIETIKYYEGLVEEIVFYAFDQDGPDSRARDAAILNNCMLVSALFMTIIAVLVFNPPQFAAFKESGDRQPSWGPCDVDAEYTCIAGRATVAFFVTAVFSTLFFAVSIIAGTMVNVQMFNAITRDAELPTFTWRMRRFHKICWHTMNVGILLCMYAFASLIFMTYPKGYSWPSLGVAALTSIIVMVMLVKSHWHWSRKYRTQSMKMIMAEFHASKAGKKC